MRISSSQSQRPLANCSAKARLNCLLYSKIRGSKRGIVTPQLSDFSRLPTVQRPVGSIGDLINGSLHRLGEMYLRAGDSHKSTMTDVYFHQKQAQGISMRPFAFSVNLIIVVSRQSFLPNLKNCGWRRIYENGMYCTSASMQCSRRVTRQSSRHFQPFLFIVLIRPLLFSGYAPINVPMNATTNLHRIEGSSEGDAPNIERVNDMLVQGNSRDRSFHVHK